MFPPVQLLVARAELKDSDVMYAALTPGLADSSNTGAVYFVWYAEVDGSTTLDTGDSGAATAEARTDSDASAEPGNEDLDSGSLADSSADEDLNSGSLTDSGDDDLDSGSLTDSSSDEDLDSGSLTDSGGGGSDVTADAGGDDDMPKSVAPSGRAVAGNRTARISIPPLMPNATADQKKFHDAAERAVRRVYVEDFSDAAILESLKGKVTSDQGLLVLRADWQQPIDDAIARAGALLKISWSLRHLDKAFARAEYDPDMTTYRDVDIVKCREAFKRIYDEDETLVEMKVTIGEIGTRALEQLEIFCLDSHAIVLMDRDFPPIKGRKKLRKQVKKAYRKAFTGTKVRRVTLEGNWQKNPDDETERTLRAIVGIERKDAFPEDPCVMQEVVLIQTKERRRWGKPQCCEIESSLAIACDVLK